MNDDQIIQALKGAVGTVPDHPVRVELIRHRASRARQRRLSEGLGCMALAVAVVAGTVAVDRATPARVAVSDEAGPVESLADAVARTKAASPLAWSTTYSSTTLKPLPSGFPLSTPSGMTGRWDFERNIGTADRGAAGEARYVDGRLLFAIRASDRERLPTGSKAEWSEASDYDDIEVGGGGTYWASVRAPVVVLATLRDAPTPWTRQGLFTVAGVQVTRYSVPLPSEATPALVRSTETVAQVDVDSDGRIRRVSMTTVNTYDSAKLAELDRQAAKQRVAAQAKLRAQIDELKRKYPEHAESIEENMGKGSPLRDFSASNLFPKSTTIEMTISDFGQEFEVPMPPAEKIIPQSQLLREHIPGGSGAPADDGIYITGHSGGTITTDESDD